VCLDFIYGARNNRVLILDDVVTTARLLGIERRLVARIKDSPGGLEQLRKPYEVAALIRNVDSYFFNRLSHYLNQLDFNPDLPAYYRFFRPRHWPGIGYLFSTREAALARALSESKASVTRSQFRALMEVVDTLPRPLHVAHPSEVFDRGNRICAYLSQKIFPKVKNEFREFLIARGEENEEISEESLLRHMQEVTQIFLNGAEFDVILHFAFAHLYGRINGLTSPAFVQYTWHHTRSPRKEKMIKAVIGAFFERNRIKGKNMRAAYEEMLLDAFFGLVDESAAALTPESIKQFFSASVRSQVLAITSGEEFQLPTPSIEPVPPQVLSSSSRLVPPPTPTPSSIRQRERRPSVITTTATVDDKSPSRLPSQPLAGFQIDYLRRGNWRVLLRAQRGVKYREYLQVCNALLGESRMRGGHTIYRTPFRDAPIFVVTAPKQSQMPPAYVLNLRRLVNRMIIENPDLEIETES